MSKLDQLGSDRPLSVIASDFGAALDSIFDTDDSFFKLSVDLQEKKEAVETQSKELKDLEAQIQAAENRLRRVKRQSQAVNSMPASSKAEQAPDQGSSNDQTPTPTPPANRTTFNTSLAAPATPLDRPHSSVGHEYTMVDRTEARRPTTSQRA